MNKVWVWIMLCFFVGLGDGEVRAGQLSDISGMVQVSKNSFLIVHDKKNKNGVPNVAPRLGILRVGKEGLFHDQVELDDPHNKATLPPNDLESVCAVPGKTNEYFLAESGYRTGAYGRIFHVRVWEGEERWKAEIVSTFQPLPLPHKDYSTPDEDQIEGMGCVLITEQKVLLLLARRGGNLTPAMLIWGTVDGLGETTLSFVKGGEGALTEGPSPLGGRGAGDLFIQKEEEGVWRIWTAATVDLGDAGPFRSLIFSPGIVTMNKEQRAQFHPGELEARWHVEGLKVEALAEPAKRIPGSALSIGTDDENYGGIWRPLFAPSEMSAKAFSRE